VSLVGGEGLPARVHRGTAGRHPPGARLRRALGRGRKGAARRDFSTVGRQGLGALGTAESTIGQGVVAEGANTTSTACAPEGAGRGRFYSGVTLLPLRRSKGQA
jgi:hypothetical protein